MKREGEMCQSLGACYLPSITPCTSEGQIRAAAGGRDKRLGQPEGSESCCRDSQSQSIRESQDGSGGAFGN